MVANPTNLAEYKLAPIDVEGEMARAGQGLGEIPVIPLPPQTGERASLANLINCLREGYDILYLVCHGALIKDEPWLWLEDETGQVERVNGTDLVLRFKELQQRPSLVVLASCQSAAPGAGDALSALGQPSGTRLFAEARQNAKAASAKKSPASQNGALSRTSRKSVSLTKTAPSAAYASARNTSRPANSQRP
jgi:hypothetical protein